MWLRYVSAGELDSDDSFPPRLVLEDSSNSVNQFAFDEGSEGIDHTHSLGWFDPNTTSLDLRGVFFSVRSVSDGMITIVCPLPTVPQSEDIFYLISGMRYTSQQHIHSVRVNGSLPSIQTVSARLITGVTIHEVSSEVDLYLNYDQGNQLLQLSSTGDDYDDSNAVPLDLTELDLSNVVVQSATGEWLLVTVDVVSLPSVNTEERLLISNIVGAILPEFWADEEDAVIHHFASFSRNDPLYLNFTEGLVAWWKMDEGSGNLIDEVNGEVATKSGTLTYSETGMVDSAIRFDNNAYAYTGSMSDLPSGDFTISMWFKRSISTLNLIRFNVTDGRVLRLVYVTGQGYLFKWTNDANTVIYGTTTEYSDIGFTWHHIVLTRSSGILQFYVDGSEIPTTGTDSESLSNSSAYLAYGPSLKGNVYLDQLRIWDEVLSASLVSDLYSWELNWGQDPLNTRIQNVKTVGTAEIDSEYADGEDYIILANMVDMPARDFWLYLNASSPDIRYVTQRADRVCYLADTSKWQEVSFDNGSSEPLIGSTIEAGMHSGILRAVYVIGGTWEGGDVEGLMVVSDTDGAFEDDETVIQDSGTIAQVNGDGEYGIRGFSRLTTWSEGEDVQTYPAYDIVYCVPDSSGELTTILGSSRPMSIDSLFPTWSPISGGYQAQTISEKWMVGLIFRRYALKELMGEIKSEESLNFDWDD